MWAMAGGRPRMTRKRFLEGLAAGAGAALTGPALAGAATTAPRAPADRPNAGPASPAAQRRAQGGPVHIDIHNHTIPRAYVEAARRDSTRLGTRIEEAGPGRVWVAQENGRRIQATPSHMDQQVRLREMDAANIDVTVESLLPPLLPYWAPTDVGLANCRTINDAIAADVAQYPDRIVGMGLVPLQDVAAAIGELERLVRDLKMPSVLLGCNVAGKNFDEPELFPFFQRAQELDVLVYFHPDVPEFPRLDRYYLTNLIGNPLDTSIAITSLIFGGVVERLPNLKLCFAHAGGYAPWIRGRWAHGQEHRPEPKTVTSQPFDEAFARLYFDSLIFRPDALEFLLRSVGAEHVLLGTDYPADMGRWDQVPLIQELSFLTPAERDLVLGGNAARLLGIGQRAAAS
jgi:aminocarboxymuconate-semialdehyde decarboxylase